MPLLDFKKYWIHLTAIVLFFLSTMTFFYPSFQGKKLNSHDTIEWQGMAKEVKDYKEKTGKTALWTNSLFGGMPTYYISHQSNHFLIACSKVLSLGLTSEAGRFIMGMICFYILMLVLKVNPILGIIGSLLFAYSTNNLVLLFAGHLTKVSTIMSSPLVIAGVIAAYRKEYLKGLVVFGFGMAINLNRDHPQMTYYLGMCMAIYVMIIVFNNIKEKEWSAFLKSSAALAIGLLLALGTFSFKLLPTLEYQSETMRGKPILSKSAMAPNSSSVVEGLDWNYAMHWSNGSIDLLCSFISHIVGGSTTERVNSSNEFSRRYNRRIVPMYWGGLPSTSGPCYFGAVIFMLFFIGLFYIKDSIKWWALFAVLLTFGLSMGKNLPFLNEFLFNNFPAFNKFRSPNSVLSVTVIIIPILAILTMDKFLKEKDFNFKTIFLPGLILAAFCILLGLLGPSIFDFNGQADALYAQQDYDISLLIKDRIALMRKSCFNSAIYMLLSLGVLYAYSKGKIGKLLTMLAIGLIAMVDQFIVNSKYVSSDNYTSAREYRTNFGQRPVDVEILKDPTLYYRVFDTSVNAFSSALASNFHKSVGGYHAAKLQRYHDLIDFHISKINPKVLNMLNTKYIIYGEQGAEKIQRNTSALGNAWFVDSLIIVNSADEEIEALNSFDPAMNAVIHKEYQNYIQGLNLQQNGTIELTHYAPDELEYSSNSTHEQLAVFSEIWYGPNKGWKAYIDDKEVEHIRCNYALRAMKIPAGQHKIKFIFEPDSVKLGTGISWFSNLSLLALLILFFFRVYKHGWDNAEIL